VSSADGQMIFGGVICCGFVIVFLAIFVFFAIGTGIGKEIKNKHSNHLHDAKSPRLCNRGVVPIVEYSDLY
jgi:hypothetical protein